MPEISLNPILTVAGLASLSNAEQTGIAASIGFIALGDIGSTPVPSVVALQNELVRVPCFSGGKIGNQKVALSADVPAGTPEFLVRELGFFLDDGVTLLAYWSHPEQALGTRSQLLLWFFKFIFGWNATGNITVTFDTTNTIAAVAADVYSLEAKIDHTLQEASLIRFSD